jgi:mannosyltransferase
MSAQAAVAPVVALLRLPRVRTAALVLGVAALTALAIVLRSRALGAPFWIDEGLSVGIATHPIADIPSVLRLDGSPPLYYMLLHLWIGVAGDSVGATHQLSVLFAVLAVPAAAWALRPVFGVSAAVAAAALVALSPFVGLYADEVRMYSLVFLLATLATGAIMRAFVVRRRRWAAGSAVLMAALLYTHAWGAFFVGSAGVVGLLALAFARDRRALLADLVVAFGGTALLFAPWVPTALEQSRHTGAPWSHAPTGHSLTRALTRILSGTSPEWVLLAAGGAGALLVLWRGDATQRRAVLALAAATAGTLMLGYLASRVVTPAWSLHYLVIMLAPLLLGLGAVLGSLGPVGAAAIAVVGLTMWNGAPSATQLEHKSNVADVAAAFGSRLPAGSVVFSVQPEQVAVLRYYLPGRLRYATPLGPVADPRVMDWRDAMRRLRAARYDPTLGRVARALRPGQRLLLVNAQFGHPTAPWTRAIQAIARSWPRRLRRDRRLCLLGSVSPLRFGNRSTVSGLLFVRAAHASPRRRLPLARRADLPGYVTASTATVPSSSSGSRQQLVTAWSTPIAVAAAVGYATSASARRIPSTPNRPPPSVRRSVMPSVTRMTRSPECSSRSVTVKPRSSSPVPSAG